MTLSFVHALRLLSVHPSLCRDSITSNTVLQPLEECYPEDYDTDSTQVSPKVDAIQRIIQAILQTTDELILVISSYTQIMDYFCRICDAHNWGYFRLDGSTEVTQRQSIVNSFNSRFTSKRIFILSARAGGVGLNITGASRVVRLNLPGILQ